MKYNKTPKNITLLQKNYKKYNFLFYNNRMQSNSILRTNTDTNNSVMQYYPRLRSSIDKIQNNAIINIQNAVRSKIARTKVKNVIEERKKEINDKRNALIKNMQNTIMAQGVINELIDTAANKGESNKKQKAATKIQGAFKKIKDKKDLIESLNIDKWMLSGGIKALNERLILEQDALKRYSDNPKKLAKMELQIKKTINEIQEDTKKYNFITKKLEKI